MNYEVKIFRLGREGRFNSYLFQVFADAMNFIHVFQETHGKNWVIEFIQE